MTRRSLWALPFFVGVIVSCAAPPPPQSTPNPQPLASVASSAPPPAPSSMKPSDIVKSPCVLHSGSASGQKPKSSTTGEAIVSCSFDAECIAVPGKAMEGDGFASVHCENLACTCAWSSANDARVLRSSFTLDAACTNTDRAKSAFLAHCMTGLRLHEPGTP